MSRQTVTAGGREDTTEFRHELLSRLGLRANASDQDVESAHNGLVEFLELAPSGVQSWAAARTTDVDEAFALLSGPEQDLIAPAASAVTVTKDVQYAASPPPAPSKVDPPAAPKPRKSGRTQLVWAIVPLLVVAVVLGVYYMGKSDVPGIEGTPTNSATTAAPGPTSAPVDKVKVAALMKKITANPKDVASLQLLGDAYFAAADYKNAAGWEQKILTVDPKNQTALLSLGAAEFNQGNAAAAKKQWLIAAGLYPKNAEVHYDLGFLYLSQTPPDKVNMTAEWNKVIAIDPNSALAKTVASHLKAPSATATPSAK
ncbi:MAG: hypothetical protein ABIP19_07820 [Dermatophilaceae bacterium]